MCGIPILVLPFIDHVGMVTVKNMLQDVVLGVLQDVARTRQ